MNWMRRKFLQGSTLLGAGWLASHTVAAQHEQHQMPMPDTGKGKSNKKTAPGQESQKPMPGHEGMDMKAAAPGELVPVITPDLARLPFTVENGVKVFRLTAEVVECEFVPASHMGPARKVNAWGYNGSVPGPAIEVNEGDRVRVIFTNKLPEATTVHWHGLEIPIEMDGTPNISQPMIEPGGTFTYEFTLHQNGTFFYHSHGAMQEMLGMIGMFIIHPKTPHTPRADKDYGIILQEWALLPNNNTPNTLAMEFNWLTMNGKSAPATTPLIVKQGERVRLRLVNLGMDHHPIHLHGHQFYVTGTEGGRIPEAGWYPGNTVLVGVAQARDVEFVAKYTGDWMLHCHMPHHMMNQMVSMVGPMAMMHGGSQTGKGMEEGMGVVRQGHALSDDLGPGFGRGMGMTTTEKNVSNLVGQIQPAAQGEIYACPMHPEGTSDKPGKCPKCGMTLVKKQVVAVAAQAEVYTCQMHPEVISDKPGKCPKCGMTLVKKQSAVALSDEERKRVPGYPQDMMMVMDEEVAKPETWGLAPGWTASMMGMMTLVRVLPEEKYNEVMARVNAGKTEKPQAAPGHKHGE